MNDNFPKIIYKFLLSVESKSLSYYYFLNALIGYFDLGKEQNEISKGFQSFLKSRVQYKVLG